MACVLEMGFASLNDFFNEKNFRMCDYVRVCEHCMKFIYSVPPPKKYSWYWNIAVHIHLCTVHATFVLL